MPLGAVVQEEEEQIRQAAWKRGPEDMTKDGDIEMSNAERPTGWYPAEEGILFEPVTLFGKLGLSENFVVRQTPGGRLPRPPSYNAVEGFREDELVQGVLPFNVNSLILSVFSSTMSAAFNSMDIISDWFLFFSLLFSKDYENLEPKLKILYGVFFGLSCLTYAVTVASMGFYFVQHNEDKKTERKGESLTCLETVRVFVVGAKVGVMVILNVNIVILYAAMASPYAITSGTFEGVTKLIPIGPSSGWANPYDLMFLVHSYQFVVLLLEDIPLFVIGLAIAIQNEVHPTAYIASVVSGVSILWKAFFVMIRHINRAHHAGMDKVLMLKHH